jgi:hypothetical protein
MPASAAVKLRGKEAKEEITQELQNENPLEEKPCTQ